VSTDVQTAADSRIRAAGQRYTQQRRALVDLLSAAGSPLAIPEILERAEGLKQSSVYRNLATLERAGVVQRVVTDDEWGRYELTEELTGHHHHLVCANCGRVRDVQVPAALEKTVDRALDRLARGAGFASVSHRLDLIGVCSECADVRD
jgi:Fur family ferric uptake transcriptional regulator